MVNRAGDIGNGILWLALERIHRSILVVPRGGRHHARPSPDSAPRPGATRVHRPGWDYSYTSLDPMDRLTFWTVQQYADDASNNIWGTWITEIWPYLPNP